MHPYHAGGVDRCIYRAGGFLNWPSMLERGEHCRWKHVFGLYLRTYKCTETISINFWFKVCNGSSDDGADSDEPLVARPRSGTTTNNLRGHFGVLRWR